MPLLFPYPVFHFGFGFFLKAKIVFIYLTAPVLVLAWGIFAAECVIWLSDQGLNPGPLHWECWLLTTRLPVKFLLSSLYSTSFILSTSLLMPSTPFFLSYTSHWTSRTPTWVKLYFLPLLHLASVRLKTNITMMTGLTFIHLPSTSKGLQMLFHNHNMVPSLSSPTVPG